MEQLKSQELTAQNFKHPSLSPISTELPESSALYSCLHFDQKMHEEAFSLHG
jgi:hypothetical protein